MFTSFRVRIFHLWLPRSTNAPFRFNKACSDQYLSWLWIIHTINQNLSLSISLSLSLSLSLFLFLRGIFSFYCYKRNDQNIARKSFWKERRFSLSNKVCNHKYQRDCFNAKQSRATAPPFGVSNCQWDNLACTPSSVTAAVRVTSAAWSPNTRHAPMHGHSLTHACTRARMDTRTIRTHVPHPHAHTKRHISCQVKETLAKDAGEVVGNNSPNTRIRNNNKRWILPVTFHFFGARYNIGNFPLNKELNKSCLQGCDAGKVMARISGLRTSARAWGSR